MKQEIILSKKYYFVKEICQNDRETSTKKIVQF